MNLFSTVLFAVTGAVQRVSRAALTTSEVPSFETEYQFIVDDIVNGSSSQPSTARFFEYARSAQARVRRIARALIDRHTWNRIAGTFIKHLPRIFGRVVTRIEYTLESNANKQFIPTLRMFIVKPKRVIGEPDAVAEPTAAAHYSKNSESENDREYVSSEESKVAASLDAKKNRGTQRSNGKESVSSHHDEEEEALPLSCEAWETALNERLLHSADAPEKDLFPDDTTRRRLLLAKARQAREEGYVEEVCKPLRASWLPPWLQSKFGWSGTESLARLLSVNAVDVCANNRDGNALDTNNVDGISAECRNAIDERSTQFRCEVSVPVVAHSCLIVESLYRNKDVAVTISQVHVWDTAVIGFILFLVGISILKPVLVSNKWLQMGAAGALGIFFVLIVVVWWIVRDLRKTRLGQVGIVAMITAGGIISFSETVTSMLWYYLTVESRTNPTIQIALVVAALGSAFVSRFFFYERVPTITHYSLSALQVVTWIALCSHNREAAALIVAILLLSKMRAFVAGAVWFAVAVTLALLWPLLLIFRALRWIFGAKKSAFADEDDGMPREVLPEQASRAQAYVRPVVSEGIFGPTAEAKFRKYEAQGSEFTRRALRELGSQIRSQPHVLAKLHDPNGVARYFGVTADANGDYVGSDNE